MPREHFLHIAVSKSWGSSDDRQSWKRYIDEACEAEVHDTICDMLIYAADFLCEVYELDPTQTLLAAADMRNPNK